MSGRLAKRKTIEKMQLKELETLPEQLYTCTPQQLHSILPEPTLLHLLGKKGQPLFISGMLHGNEPTGFLAIQMLLNKYKKLELPRPLTLFLGNSLAAQSGLRRLDDQPDFNRIWPGSEEPDSPEKRLARQIFERMQQRNLFASIDIHNNTGLNPHYACINRLDNRFLQLASLFGRLIVYFTRPKGVLSNAFAELCPSVTLECGRPGQRHGVEHAFDYLDSCLHLKDLSEQPVAHQNIDLFHTVAQVKVPENIRFSFTDSDADLMLDTELERMNFTEIPTGTVFGTLQQNGEFPVVAQDESGADVTHEFFQIKNHELFINRKSMPSMLTLDERVIRQDCLCYLMERLPL